MKMNIFWIITYLIIANYNAFCNEGLLRALKLLLSIKEEYCADIIWCTLGAVLGTTSLACCHTCFCTDQCVKYGDCCPDYELSKSLGGQVYGNVSELFTVLENKTVVDHVTVLPAARDSLKTHIYDSDDTTINQCVRAHMHEFVMKSIHTRAYEMVASCPYNYSRKDIIQKCQQRTHDLEQPNLDHLVPVTSSVTGLVYKNKHCFACGYEHNATAVKWDMFLFCSRRYMEEGFKSMVARNPYELFLEYYQYGLSNDDCIIVYKIPKVANQRRVPKRCLKIDINSCNQSSNISNSNTDLEQACSLFKSPVSVNSEPKNIKTVFKNIACAYCNGIAFNISCTHINYEITLQLDLSNLKNDEHINVYEKLAFLDVNTKDISDQHECKMGYIYDKYEDICHKLLCPRRMYSFNGTCAAMFSHVTTVYVYHSVMLNVTTSEIIMESDAAEFELKLYTKIDSLLQAKPILIINSISLWMKPKAGKASVADYYFVFFTFYVEKISGQYIDGVEAVYELLQERISIYTRHQQIDVIVALTITVEMGFDTAKDLNDQKALHRIVPSHWYIHNTDIYIPISKASYCYRIALNQSDVIIMTPYHYALKRAPHHVFNEFQYYKRFKDDSIYAVVVCADDMVSAGVIQESVLERRPTERPADIDMTNTGKNGIETNDIVDYTSKEFALTILVVSFILVLGIVVICRHRRRASNSG